MSTDTVTIDVDRLVLLIQGREGKEIPGCCGARELHIEEPTPEECEYIQKNICKLLNTHECEGFSDGVFIGKDCQCDQKCVRRRKQDSDPNACSRHAEYEIEKLYMWGYLMDSCYSIHDNTWKAILDGLCSLSELDHCVRYHLFRCLDELSFNSNRFRMVWDFLKDSLPKEFAEFKCCSEGCCRLRYYSQGATWPKEECIPIFSMSGHDPGLLEKFEYYVEDYLQHRRDLGLTEPVPVVNLCRKEDSEIIQEIPQENNIEIVEQHMLLKSTINRSVKCMELFAQDNPRLVKMYTYSYLSDFKGYAFNPIIHCALTINAHACSLEQQKETARLLCLLIRLGADVHAPTIVDGVKIFLGNMLELYEYNYPGSPVRELFESLGDGVITHDSSDKVKDAMKLLKPSFEEQSMFDGDSVYTFLRRYGYVKDLSLFEKIARDALEKYRKDWVKAGNRFPYTWMVGIGFRDAQPIGDVINGVDDGLSPDEIEKKVWG